jgi:hypothetical protein
LKNTVIVECSLRLHSAFSHFLIHAFAHVQSMIRHQQSNNIVPHFSGVFPSTTRSAVTLYHFFSTYSFCYTSILITLSSSRSQHECVGKYLACGYVHLIMSCMSTFVSLDSYHPQQKSHLLRHRQNKSTNLCYKLSDTWLVEMAFACGVLL